MDIRNFSVVRAGSTVTVAGEFIEQGWLDGVYFANVKGAFSFVFPTVWNSLTAAEKDILKDKLAEGFVEIAKLRAGL